MVDILRVDWKCNMIFFDSQWVLFSCIVQLHFSGKTAFNFEYGSENENVCLLKVRLKMLCKLRISQ